ncbi:MAG TPA: gamma-glutamyltransferase [Solirubrobacteraceae bacterium]|nr:gamma-glutamyltransferase [Solirubrobacteraceae bacterium]
MRGVVAAGHELTARAGAEVLRAGGNAVDAALAALLTSFVAEPLLTGLGAGGYMLVADAAAERRVLDFSVEASGRGADPGRRAQLVAIDVSFGDADQVFNIGPASVGCYGMPAGIWEASRRYGSVPLPDLVAPAARMARDGVPLNPEQAYVVDILAGIVTAEPECAAVYAPGDNLLRAGDAIRQPELADTLERLGREGPQPFYHGDIARAVADWLAERAGLLTPEDLDAYRVVNRRPLAQPYRGREVLLNPPPSAGGTLIAFALAQLEADGDGPPALERLVEVMEAAQAQRTPEFLASLGDPRRLGSTTHISVLDADGRACSVTTSNGEGAGIIVPGTGIHLNNMLGEQDLNPLGFHKHPPGRRLPSMMSPTVVLRDGVPELVLGSGGSNRIRSAILQTVVNVVDRGMDVQSAVCAPRAHFEDGIVYVEPGEDVAMLEAAGRTLARFRDLNLFFGGVNAATADPLAGVGDPRRGGAAAAL